MRYYGGTDAFDYPLVPDTIGVAVISSAAAVVAQDWPSGAHLVSIDAEMGIFLNLRSTAVSIPTTNSSGSTLTSGGSWYQPTGHNHKYRISALTTGYSITARTTGVVTLSFWKISG